MIKTRFGATTRVVFHTYAVVLKCKGANYRWAEFRDRDDAEEYREKYAGERTCRVPPSGRKFSELVIVRIKHLETEGETK